MAAPDFVSSKWNVLDILIVIASIVVSYLPTCRLRCPVLAQKCLHQYCAMSGTRIMVVLCYRSMLALCDVRYGVRLHYEMSGTDVAYGIPGAISIAPSATCMHLQVETVQDAGYLDSYDRTDIGRMGLPEHQPYHPGQFAMRLRVYRNISVPMFSRSRQPWLGVSWYRVVYNNVIWVAVPVPINPYSGTHVPCTRAVFLLPEY
eukprot:2358560-Rhodomonas_salina.1